MSPLLAEEEEEEERSSHDLLELLPNLHNIISPDSPFFQTPPTKIPRLFPYTFNVILRVVHRKLIPYITVYASVPFPHYSPATNSVEVKDPCISATPRTLKMATEAATGQPANVQAYLGKHKIQTLFEVRDSLLCIYSPSSGSHCSTGEGSP